MPDLRQIETIAALSPLHVGAYLRARGWEDRGAFGAFGRVYSSVVDGRNVEVVLPTRSKILDFSRRMMELVERIATIENRSVATTIFDLSLTSFDVIRVRSLDADAFGSIELDDGIHLLEEAKRLLTSSALAAAADRPRRAWKGRRPETVNEYMQHVRLGQTENASFSLTMLSPYAFDPSAQDEMFPKEAFGRRVTRTFGGALRAVEAALGDAVSESIDAFERTIEAGVSAELCQSLAKLADNDSGVEVSVAWSPAKPLDAPVRVRLSREDAAILRDVSRNFSYLEPEPGFLIEGLIEEIKEKPERFDGSVLVQAKLPDQNGIRKIRVTFDEKDREVVFRAAEGKKWIRVTGELVREANSVTLKNPREFAMIEPTDQY